MLTPLPNPPLLTSMNFPAGPWNQVAVIQPSSCQTVRKRSQSPASRHRAQFWTTSMICSLSLTSGSIGGPRSVQRRAGDLHDFSPLHDLFAQELVELLDRHAHRDGALLRPGLLHVGGIEDLVDVRVQLFQDGPRRL